jgi:GNAT superfamily N-acetyltransferase
MKVYVRRSVRYLTNTPVKCLDVASIEVDEDHRGNGVFTAFLNRFEQEAKKLNRVVYVESILEPRLYQFLLTKGYKDVPGTCETSPTVFKIIT